MQVLLGMKKILTHFRPTLVLELKAAALTNLGASMEGVLSLLNAYGYERSETLSDQDSVWTPKQKWVPNDSVTLRASRQLLHNHYRALTILRSKLFADCKWCCAEFKVCVRRSPNDPRGMGLLT